MNNESLKIIQELDSHLKKRKEIKQMLSDKNISMLNSPDNTISNMIEKNLQPSQTMFYVTMKRELIEKGFHEFRLLGQGAQGLVLLAKNQDTNRRYAIKGVYIRDQNENINQIAKKQVEQEVKLLKACKDSPYILNLIDQFDGNDFTFLLFSEYKGTLSQIIEQTPNRMLNELSSIKYAKDIAEGLYYIHSQKCLVNDIKMDNILIDYNGNAVVADFGFADCLSKTNGFGMSECKGNDFYKAPECCNPKDYDGYNNQYIIQGINVSNKPSAASEACSLGYLIYTMFTGWQMDLMLNKHKQLNYSNNFSTFTYEKQLRYIVDGLTKFNPSERLSIKEVLIVLKGIVSFEFNLDEKFVQLMKDDIQNVNIVAQSFNQQIEFVLCLKNQFYPIVQDEVSLKQDIQISMQQGLANNYNQVNQTIIIQQKESIQRLNQEIEQLNQKLTKCQNENQEKNILRQKEQANYSNKIDQLNQTIFENKQQIQKKDEQIQKLEEQIQQLNQELTNQKNENQNMKNLMKQNEDNYSNQIYQFTQNINQKEQQIQNSSGLLKQKNQELNKCQNENQGYKQQIQEFGEKVKQLNQDLTKYQDENQKLKQNCSDYSNQINQLNQTIIQKKQQILNKDEQVKQLNQDLTKYQDENQKMQQDQASYSREINQLKETIIQLQKSIQDLDEQKKQLNEDLIKYWTENQESIQTNIQVKKNISKLNAQLKELEKKAQWKPCFDGHNFVMMKDEICIVRSLKCIIKEQIYHANFIIKIVWKKLCTPFQFYQKMLSLLIQQKKQLFEAKYYFEEKKLRELEEKRKKLELFREEERKKGFFEKLIKLEKLGFVEVKEEERKFRLFEERLKEELGEFEGGVFCKFCDACKFCQNKFH